MLFRSTLEVGEAGPALARLLKDAKPHSYVAFMAYVTAGAASEKALGAMRAAVRDRTGFATTAGYGPRFLHSTGQLHKGGPKEGVFVQVVQDDRKDVAIPGEPYSFSVLKQAQALGDERSLRKRRLPLVRVSIGADHAAGWKALTDSVAKALK